MKKVFFISAMLCCFISTTSIASSINPEIDKGTQKIVLRCQTIDVTHVNEGFHRTPPQIPNVYLDASTSTVYFENPCYECTLELVIPGTDTVVYASAIEDEAETFQIPNGFIGTYELHIHRGNYCFWGEIEL